MAHICSINKQTRYSKKKKKKTLLKKKNKKKKNPFGSQFQILPSYATHCNLFELIYSKSEANYNTNNNLTKLNLSFHSNLIPVSSLFLMFIKFPDCFKPVPLRHLPSPLFVKYLRIY